MESLSELLVEPVLLETQEYVEGGQELLIFVGVNTECLLLWKFGLVILVSQIKFMAKNLNVDSAIIAGLYLS
jgi:hypothetical protein